MLQKGRGDWFVVLAVMLLVVALPAAAQAKGLLVPGAPGVAAAGHDPTIPAGCRGAGTADRHVLKHQADSVFGHRQRLVQMVTRGVGALVLDALENLCLCLLAESIEFG